MTIPTHRIHTTAFTLVELSIVLVILGLLIGGVMAGSAMVRASELRSVVGEYTHYQAAIGTFRDKYYALPGDMPNAVSFWGATAGGTADGVDSTCAALGYGGGAATGTCNGNGDRLIGNTSATSFEMLRAWQHLALAGLIEGQYTGVPGPSNNQVPGSNIPQSHIRAAGWMVYGIGSYVGDSTFFAADYGNTFSYGSLTGGVLTGAEAYSIDQKLDDGNPQTGTVMQYHAAAEPNCLAAGETAYNLSDSTAGCVPIFITGY